MSNQHTQPESTTPVASPDLTTEISPARPLRRPRRTLNRLALALAGVGAAGLGQYFFSQESLWDGLFLYGIGAILFASALLDRSISPSLSPLTNTPLPTGWRRNVGVWLIVSALGLSGVAYTLFGEIDGVLTAWWLYVGSLILALLGGGLLTQQQWPRLRGWRPSRQDYLLISLLVIIIVALFMRLYHFGSQPFGIWFDEAEAGLVARRLLQEPTYRPILYAPINISGHLLILYALALEWLGDNIHSMRLVSVAFGLGGVLMAYFFGRELRGPRFGLALAFFVAVARWHVNFSRIAMTGVDAPFFEFLSLYLLTRWLRHQRLQDAVLAGLSLGLGLMFYTAFRLYVVALLLFVLIALLIWWRWVWARWQDRSGWVLAGQGLALLVSIWLGVMPLVQFAAQNPDEFWYRTRQISIFTKRDQANVGQALWENSYEHLLMFNFAGDRNGRHNLPGKPMLDPVMGMLWLLGAALAVSRLFSRRRHPADLFFVILFFTALVGGVFSVDFESPQSLRSIAVIPAVIYFCGVTTAALGREWESAFARLSPSWMTIPTVVVAGFLLYSNASTYFITQHRDFASWNAFSSPETIVGREMAALGPDYTYLLSPFFANHPAIRFLAPEAKDQHPLLPPDALPIRRPADRPVALFIHPDDIAFFEQAQALYPNAEFRISTSQATDERPVVYFVNLQPEDIASVQGVQLTYWPPEKFAEEEATVLFPPLEQRHVSTINVTWPQDGPDVEAFIAEWAGVLFVPHFGTYNLRLHSPGPAILEIDERVVLEGAEEQQVLLTLAEGNHTLRLQANSGAGQVALLWQPPGFSEGLIPQWSLYVPPITNHGLQGSYYPNDSWAGEPTLQRIDPNLDTYFHLIPMQRPYTVEWTGWLDAPQAGNYRLGLRAVQEAELFIDGERLLTTEQPNLRTDTDFILTAGLHDIRVRFKDNVDRSRIHLYWTKPDGETEPIPSENLWPPLGRPPESVATQQMPAPTVEELQLQWRATLGSQGSAPGQFLEPRDVAVLASGNLVVADTANKRVQILDSNGGVIQSLTGDEFPFEEPLAVVINKFNEILVLDSTLQWVYRYDSTGTFINRFAGPEARLFHPRGMTIFADGTVALADTGSARLVFFNQDGSFRGQIGSLGDGPGQFIEPTDILEDGQGGYFVAEAETNRIQQVDSGGQSLNQWLIPPTYAFNGPHLAAAPDGSFFMTEIQSQSLIRYAPDGSLLHQWQSIGPITFGGPVGIYFDPVQRLLYVTDVILHQVHVFEVMGG